MPEGRIEQKLPKRNTDGAFAAGMKVGFFQRGAFDRFKSEVEDVLRAQAIIAAGEHMPMVEAAKAAADPKIRIKLEAMRPNEAFLYLSGMSRDTYDARLASIETFGPIATDRLRAIGVPWKDIRIPADAPAGLKREIKALTDGGRLLRPEDLDSVVNKMVELLEARQASDVRAEKAERAQSTAEAKQQKLAEKVIEKDERIKDLEAELKLAREGAAVSDEVLNKALAKAHEHAQQVIHILASFEKSWKGNPEIAGRCNKTILEILGPCSRLKVECLKAMGFGQE
jgi:hypothetical protein